MWYITSNNSNLGYGVKHIVADSASDLKAIPTVSCNMGSTVFVIEESQTYMLGGNKKWTAVTLSDDTGSNSNSGTGAGTGSDSSSGDGSSSDGSSESGSEYTVVDGGTAAG